MNKLDRYYFFLQKAITNVEYEKRYLFARRYNILFCIIETEIGVVPCFRNENVQIDKNQLFLLNRLINDKLEIVEIPKISLLDKKFFLSDFVNKEKDIDLKEKLRNSLVLFDENSDFLNYFLEVIQIVDKRKAYAFHMHVGSFLSMKIKEIEYSMGINENIDVIW